MSKFLIVVAILLSASSICAQSKSSKLKPKWINDQHIKHNNVAYDFIVTEGTGFTLDETKQNSFANLTTKIESERGIVVSSTLDATSTMTREKGVTQYDSKREFNIQYKEKEKTIEIRAKVIDEYWVYADGRYHCYSLYAVANGGYGITLTDDISVTTSYGINGLWRSALVPGWGQMYKGSTAKGVAMLGGTAAFVGGIIATESLRKSYLVKVNQTHDINAIRDYATQVNTMTNIRNVCIGGAVAVYIYNLIDAIVAPGARHVLVKPKVLNNLSFTTTSASTPYILGATIAYKF